MNLVPLFYPLNAAAAHGAENLSFMDFILQSNVINFAIAVLLIVWMVKKFNVGGMLQHNRDQLKAEIESLEASRIESEKRLAELKQQTANLNQEVSRILGQARESAESMAHQILEEAKQDAGRLIETSKRRIEVEQKSAAQELEKRLLADALQEARLELAQNLNASEQKRSVEAFIEELAELKQ